VVGVYGGLLDKFPMGAIVNKALTLRAGQQPGQRYAKRLFAHIQSGELDPSYLLTHPMRLEESVKGYEMFKEKSHHCLRAVFKP
jgi:threonine dehydrogenase-like Zn-dependent dehydrogenase